MVSFATVLETGWLTAYDARDAYYKMTDTRGRRACAVEVRQTGKQLTTDAKTHRLLWHKPAGREAYCIKPICYQGPNLPHYVFVEATGKWD